MNEKIAVVGAGMVGVCCALEMQRRGCNVTLIDRLEPGNETSYGNAGVVTRSSIVPINSPSLWKSLPSLLWNDKTSFRYNPFFLARNMGWASQFLFNTQPSRFFKTVSALNDLISLSMSQHRELAQQASFSSHLREDGWIFLYRNQRSYLKGETGREMFEKFDVKSQSITMDELKDLEPSLKKIFTNALWIKDGFSVDDPREFVRAYLDLFKRNGGTFLQGDVKNITQGEEQTVNFSQGTTQKFDRVIVCLGPWAKKFLEKMGYRLTMAYERGYHMHYALNEASQLSRPVYDVDGGYVMAPMAQGLRVTTGVELSDIDAPHKYAQQTGAEKAAREALSFGERLEETPWMGARPTLPDSRPIIGALPGQDKVWFAFGHQHIGLSTGPGTAKVLGALMAKETPPIDADPFNASRYLSKPR
ncbi:MAG: FAD-binding oxidoreductase [Methylocystaceae bacterium]|nr:FAD-binding oxidoreductase [Methylocystaceae bacterium]